jgi:hypothetical protein
MAAHSIGLELARATRGSCASLKPATPDAIPFLTVIKSQMQNQADDQIFYGLITLAVRKRARRPSFLPMPSGCVSNAITKAAKMRGARLARPAIVLPLGPLNLRDAPLLARREPRLPLDATFVTKIGERFLGLEAVVRVGIDLVAIDEELHALITVLGSCRPGAHDNASDK